MNCFDIKTRTDDYLDQRLTTLENAAFERHVANCALCTEEITMAKNLATELRELPVEPPSEDFEQRVLDVVRRRHESGNRRQHRFAFAAGFATAAMVAVLVWFTVPSMVTQQADEELAVIHVAMHETQTVRLMLDAPQPLQRVTLHIEMPDNIELEGYPGQRVLSWQTGLQQGANVLALPVIALQPGQGHLIARVDYGEQEKTFSLLLKSSLNGATRQLPAPGLAV